MGSIPCVLLKLFQFTFTVRHCLLFSIACGPSHDSSPFLFCAAVICFVVGVCIGIAVPVLSVYLNLYLQLFVRAGYSVALFDVSDQQLEEALKEIEQKLTTLQEEGLLREKQTASQCLKNVSLSTNLQDAVAGATYIQVLDQIFRNSLW